MVNSIEKIIARKHLFKRYTMFIFGLLLLAFTYNLLIIPNNIVLGGISGLAVIFKDNIDPYLFILLVNIVLLVFSFIFLGKKKTINTIVGIILYPLFIKLTANISTIFVIDNTDLLLMVLFAGFLQGVASGIILKYGFSTGGTDIISQIISHIFKMPVGKCYLFVDGVIIFLGGLYFGFMKVMYAVVFIYIYSLMTDKVLLGISNNKAFYIITEKADDIKKYILENLNHGVTILKAKGGFFGYREEVLLCVVPAKHYFKLKEGIEAIDNKAFFVVTDAYEVKGGA